MITRSRSSVASAPISIERARALLGADGEGLTDAEVLEASRDAEVLAHVLVRMFLESKRSERPM
jgi:hypothetical protein